MSKIKCFIICFFSILLLAIICLFFFSLWNHFPPLSQKSKGSILKIFDPIPFESNKKITVVSYNIHAAIGLSWKKQKKIKKADFLERLDRIAKILQDLNADIVLLQEVDFSAARSYYIDQSEYLAKKASYSFVAQAIQFHEHFHPTLYGKNGKITHGICILSRFPIHDNVSYLFSHHPDIPFYLRWLFNPHGAQIVSLSIGNDKITVINAHLEPWSQRIREQQIKMILQKSKKNQSPIILGGDFNALPPESRQKNGLYLLDAPWFINRAKWNLKKEQTILQIKKEGFKDSISNWIYDHDERSTFTYPSNNPKEKIDYLFAGNGAQILFGFVYHEATTASDHLPLMAKILLPSNDSSH